VSGSKVFKPGDAPESNSSGYPDPFREGQRKRWNRRLGDYGGLKNYGVNFVRVEPGGQSSARHAHTNRTNSSTSSKGSSSSSPMQVEKQSARAPASRSRRARETVITS